MSHLKEKIAEFEDTMNQEEPDKSVVAMEFDERQRRAIEEYERERKAYEETNPHKLKSEIISNPAPPHSHEMLIMGRPVDVNMLERYLVFDVSPKSNITMMRYSDAKTAYDMFGFMKRKPVKFNKTLIWLLLGAGIALVVGILFLTQGPSLTGMFGF